MNRRTFLGMCGAGLLAAEAKKPNLVLIYADDIGYGDLSCYGATAVKTPNLDRIAKQGLRFTDAHSSSATCTPSRYSMITGEYAWRRKGTGVLPGDARMIIEPGRFTLPAMLKKAGYTTGVVGKWHLGLGSGNIDWNGEIKPGPLEIGFDSAFLVPATGDRVPCVYVEDHRVVGLDPADPIRVDYTKPIGNEPTGKKNPELLKVHPSHGHDMAIVNGVSRIGYMTGGTKALWVDEDMADVLTGKAVTFLEKNRANPFFLFFSTHDIHVPRVPNRRFAGKTTMGPRGDAIAELDWSVGEVLKKLDALGLAKNTIVMFSSDNGPVVDDGYKDDAVEKLGGHKPAGPHRGGKYSNFEGGTRVPLLLRWPERVKPAVSGALVGQQDFLASFARLAGVPLPGDAGPDSMDVLDALLGKDRKGRGHIVEHARALSYREGDWKMIEPSNGPKLNAATNTELGNAPGAQLYNVATDRGETQDVAAANGERVRAFQEALNKIRTSGRSR
ncbi:MAG: arylsulfatase [Bryobacterales bacterium]|nr:arylsulfatase [Bryobacterales bacterium]